MGYSGKDVTRSKPFSSYLLIGANTIERKNECFPSVGQWVCFILSRNRNHDGARGFENGCVLLEKKAKKAKTTKNYSETTKNYTETTENHTETTGKPQIIQMRAVICLAALLTGNNNRFNAENRTFSWNFTR